MGSNLGGGVLGDDLVLSKLKLLFQFLSVDWIDEDGRGNLWSVSVITNRNVASGLVILFGYDPPKLTDLSREQKPGRDVKKPVALNHIKGRRLCW